MPELWRVYIGGLSGETVEGTLSALAARWGTVLNAEIRRKDSGRSKGFGWVDMATLSESISVVNGIRALEDSPLTATVLNPPEILNAEHLNWPPVSRYGMTGGRGKLSGSRNLDFSLIVDPPEKP